MRPKQTTIAARWPMRSLVVAGASREEWLSVRSGFSGMTGSVAPILYGAVRYNTLELEYDKRANGIEQPETGFLATCGIVLEPHILDEVCKQPIEDRPLRFELVDGPKFIQHPVFEWAACSPDFAAYTEDPEICAQYGTQAGARIVAEPLRITGEIKNRDGSLSWKYKDGECQLSERVQVAWNVACMDADVGLLLVKLFGEVRSFILPRDRAFEDELFSSARRFLDAVEARDVSALIDMTDKAEEKWDLVRAAYDTDKSRIEVDDPEIDEMISELEGFKAAKKTADSDIKRQSAAIARTMKQAERMRTARYSVSWPTLKTGKRGGLRIKELQTDDE